MTRDFYELSVRLKQGDEAALQRIKAFLTTIGVKQEQITEFVLGDQFSVVIFERSLKRARRFQSDLRVLGISREALSIRRLRAQDWVNLWKKHFKAFKLTKTLRVIPAWEKDTYADKNTEQRIFIDTQLAFGTGLHETTQQMAGLVERCAGKYRSFLDIGTGTGILSLVALKNGAETVRAIDIDQGAVTIARQNFINNGYPTEGIAVLDFAKMRSRKQYDFVAANLITHELIRLKKKLVALTKRDHYLAISGIAAEHRVRVKNAFKELPLRCLKVAQKNQWIAILYKKIGWPKDT
jgi:ribosomal protein L11 methyltransferase